MTTQPFESLIQQPENCLSHVNSSKHDDSFENSGIDFRRKYTMVSPDLRRELLRVIETEQLTIKIAAQKLGINYSTAKNIVRIFRREKRMNKLPKRVSKALEDVLRANKKPPKKLTRFVAAKCKLFNEPQTAAGPGHIYDMMKRGKHEENRFINEKEIPVTIDLECEKPHFDFQAYSPLILSNLNRNCLVCTTWVPVVGVIPTFH